MIFENRSGAVALEHPREAMSWITAALAAAAIIAASAHAVHAAGCAAGFQDAGGSICTATFGLTGAPQTVTLPGSVHGIIATVSGAEGGTSLEEQVDPFGGAASSGGKGGRQSATIPVAGGAMLTVVVGEMGTGGVLAPPGFGGYGGGGHATSRYGGNGGGGSYVFDANGPIIAAGGGGGGGYDYSPVVMGRGDQHNPGGDGSGASAAADGTAVPFCCDNTAPYTAGGGGGATPIAGGAGGHPSLPPSYIFGQVDGDYGSGPAANEFSFGNGGSTHNGCCYYTGWAGGGGGGYYGGGGGGNIEAQFEGGGGGGGAGFVLATAWATSALTGVQLGDGDVTISYYIGTCNAACASCTGPMATDCSSCPAGLVVSGGACVPATTTTTLPPPTTTTTLSPSLCDAVPRTGCRLPATGSSSIKVKNDPNDSKDTLIWKWSHGDTTLLDAFMNPPASTATYRTCVYDTSGRPQPLMQMDATGSEMCDKGKPCWKTISDKGFAYKNGAGSVDSVTGAKLLAGSQGTPSVRIKARGARVPMPGLGMSLPLTVQLVISDGLGTECWQATFTTATRNDATRVCANGP
jgi:hypothetical protein